MHKIQSILKCVALFLLSLGLQATEKTIDQVGEIWKGDVIEREVSFKNKTDNWMRIAAVRASCSCLTIKAFPAELGPGKSGLVKAIVDSRLLEPGPFRLVAYVEVAVPPGLQQIIFEGRVESLVHVSKEPVMLGLLSPMMFVARKLDLTRVESDVVIEKVTTSAPNVLAQLSHNPDHPGGWQLDINVQPVTSQGAFREKVFLHLGIPYDRIQEIDLIGTMQPWLRFSPPSLHVGRVKSGQPSASRSLRIFDCPQDVDLTLSAEKPVSASWENSEKNGILVEIAPSEKLGRHESNLTISGNNGYPPIQIPVTWEVVD